MDDISPTLHVTASLFQPPLLTNSVNTNFEVLRGPNMINGIMMQKKPATWNTRMPDSTAGNTRMSAVFANAARRITAIKKRVTCHRCGVYHSSFRKRMLCMAKAARYAHDAVLACHARTEIHPISVSKGLTSVAS